MLQRLIGQVLVKDVGFFAAAALGIYAVRGLKRPIQHPCLGAYPHICAFPPLANIMALLHDMQEVVLFSEIARKTEHFLNITAQANQGANGFLANRLATEIPEKVRELCSKASYSPSMEIATKAMDFERDELMQIQSICDNLVRNMLLSARPYA